VSEKVTEEDESAADIEDVVQTGSRTVGKSSYLVRSATENTVTRAKKLMAIMDTIVTVRFMPNSFQKSGQTSPTNDIITICTIKSSKDTECLKFFQIFIAFFCEKRLAMDTINICEHTYKQAQKIRRRMRNIKNGSKSERLLLF